MVVETNPLESGADATDRRVPRHAAIIMDGNGRWAAQRGLPRIEGHRHGMEAVRAAVRVAPELGVEYLTLYSFSSENWSRPLSEVQFLFGLLRFFIRRDLAELHQNGVRITVIGNRDGVPADIASLLAEAERLTRDNTTLRLQIAFNYGGRDEIVRAVRAIGRRIEAGALAPESIDESVIAAHLDTAGVPEPDLIIRTSGEQRLSNFLPWQAAYAELVFLPIYWPDFDRTAFAAAIREFQGRARRFGGLAAGVSA